MNLYKAPRDKLVCILNCCKVINNLLVNASFSSGQNEPGADEFLPVLIYVTIKVISFPNFFASINFKEIKDTVECLHIHSDTARCLYLRLSMIGASSNLSIVVSRNLGGLIKFCKQCVITVANV
jgi:Vacuolar sorting protein 9 (VPS9) domain